MLVGFKGVHNHGPLRHIGLNPGKPPLLSVSLFDTWRLKVMDNSVYDFKEV